MAGIENKKENEYDSSSIIKVEEGESAPSVETSDRGIFDFMGKKEDQKKPYGQEEEEANLATDFDQKVPVSELEKKNQGLLQKFRRSDSSSSSEEEVEVDGQKIKKKKGLKEKIKEKLTGDRKKEDYDTQVPVEKYEPVVHGHVKGYEEPIVHGHVEGEDQENNGFLGKIKEKLPGVAGGEEVHTPPTPVAAETPNLEGETTEKKGFLEKIKEKVPGGAGGGQHEEVHTPPPPAPVATETTATEGETTEKKGFLEKIKEKLPGHHPKTEVDNFEPHVPLDHGPTH